MRHPLHRPSCCPNSTCLFCRYGIGASISVRLGISVRAVTSRSWKRPPIAACRRTFTSSIAFGERSIPTHLRPRFSAATQAVAHPQNGSSTMSPSFEDALIMRSSSRRVAFAWDSQGVPSRCYLSVGYPSKCPAGARHSWRYLSGFPGQAVPTQFESSPPYNSLHAFINPEPPLTSASRMSSYAIRRSAWVSKCGAVSCRAVQTVLVFVLEFRFCSVVILRKPGFQVLISPIS